MNLKARDIARFLKKKIYGENILIKNISSLDTFKNHSIIFLENKKLNDKILKKITNTNLLLIKDKNIKYNFNCTYILSNSPRLDFAKIVEKFFYKNNFKKKIDKSVLIGVNSFIENGVKIEKNVKIGNNVSIFKNTIIKKNTIINDGCVIGNDGFGPIYKKKKFVQMQKHYGGVVIGKNVIIGPLTNIEKGTIDNTLIGDNVQIDALVQIGHNCIVKANTSIACGTVLCGGSKIMNNCWIGPNSTIKEGVKISKNNFIGLASSVLKNTKINSVYAGVPAKYLKKNLKNEF
jgi:UDP-3-O-[3-hydroxymyristoyl] glucosamine N-acyltransferase